MLLDIFITLELAIIRALLLKPEAYNPMLIINAQTEEIGA
tara:strand:- start:27616 stop:27735 length:120 start_codon:yes stop_codon:yes gene_type:complete